MPSIVLQFLELIVGGRKRSYFLDRSYEWQFRKKVREHLHIKANSMTSSTIRRNERLLHSKERLHQFQQMNFYAVKMLSTTWDFR